MIDLTNKNNQIELNSERLKEEYERYFEIRSRIGIITIIYSIFAVSSVQLIQFAIKYKSVGSIYNISLISFIIIFILSLFNSILLLIPKAIAYKNTPKYFYNDLLEAYEKNNQIPSGQEKYYVQESYNKELEKIIDLNFALNNKKSNYHYWAFTFALCALIPYIICSGIKITKIPNNIQEVKLTNSCFEQNEKLITKNKKELIMFKKEETTPPPPNEPKVNPDLVIETKPVMIKENKHIPETPQKPHIDSPKTDVKTRDN